MPSGVLQCSFLRWPLERLESSGADLACVASFPPFFALFLTIARCSLRHHPLDFCPDFVACRTVNLRHLATVRLGSCPRSGRRSTGGTSAPSRGTMPRRNHTSRPSLPTRSACHFRTLWGYSCPYFAVSCFSFPSATTNSLLLHVLRNRPLRTKMCGLRDAAVDQRTFEMKGTRSSTFREDDP